MTFFADWNQFKLFLFLKVHSAEQLLSTGRSPQLSDKAEWLIKLLRAVMSLPAVCGALSILTAPVISDYQ